MAVQVISFHCVLKSKLGKVLSSTFNQNVLTGSASGGLKALAEGLNDLTQGEKRQISLRADQAYGFYDPALVLKKRLDDLVMKEPVKIGEKVMYERNGKAQAFRVTEISLGFVTLDANHPLAGLDLIFEIETVAAREATVQDLAEAYSPVSESPLH